MADHEQTGAAARAEAVARATFDALRCVACSAALAPGGTWTVTAVSSASGLLCAACAAREESPP